jgi:hypothetical protein
MSVPSASFTLTASSGSYQFTVSSCNPEQPVSFLIGNEPYDPNRRSESGYLGGRFPTSLSIVTFPQVLTPSTPNQNPIKLVISSITSDQGQPTGNTGVFYGYYRQPNARELNFYLNQEQSQHGFTYGFSGITASINNTIPAITVG